MEQSSATGGWRVSQVASLLDMPRRDITRSCYADRQRGGAGILQPDDGSWGRRSYSVEDIAWLYLVKLQHEAGYSLPEIAQRMDTSAGINALCGHLDVVAGRAEEMLDGLRLRCERARALRCALSGVAKDAQGAVERYLRERIGSDEVELMQRMLTHLAVERMEEGIIFSVPIDEGTRSRFRQVLEEPGIDLAIELWAGPGAFDRLAGMLD